MLVNRRKEYCTKLAYYLSTHPELVNTFLCIICDELSISELNAIYKLMQQVSNQPPNPQLNKKLEN